MFRPITINAVANGWVVNVGCQTFAYVNKELLLVDLAEYMANPTDKEKAMLERSINTKWTNGLTPVAPRDLTPADYTSGCNQTQANPSDMAPYTTAAYHR